MVALLLPAFCEVLEDMMAVMSEGLEVFSSWCGWGMLIVRG